jgi:hypothetical protein
MAAVLGFVFILVLVIAVSLIPATVLYFVLQALGHGISFFLCVGIMWLVFIVARAFRGESE